MCMFLENTWNKLFVFCLILLKQNIIRGTDICKYNVDLFLEFDPIIYNGKYLIPAMMLDSRPYVPMSLIHPYFRQFYSFLFDLSRDYLVGTGSEIIRCMSLLEANCLSSYMAWKQGWGKYRFLLVPVFYGTFSTRDTSIFTL